MLKLPLSLNQRMINHQRGIRRYIRCHLTFDVKMDLTRKARFVAGGNIMKSPYRQCIFECSHQRENQLPIWIRMGLEHVWIHLCHSTSSLYAKD